MLAFIILGGIALLVAALVSLYLFSELTAYGMEQLDECAKNNVEARRLIRRQMAKGKPMRQWVLVRAERMVDAAKRAEETRRNDASEARRRVAAEKRLRDTLR